MRSYFVLLAALVIWVEGYGYSAHKVYYSKRTGNTYKQFFLSDGSQLLVDVDNGDKWYCINPGNSKRLSCEVSVFNASGKEPWMITRENGWVLNEEAQKITCGLYAQARSLPRYKQEALERCRAKFPSWMAGVKSSRSAGAIRKSRRVSQGAKKNPGQHRARAGRTRAISDYKAISEASRPQQPNIAVYSRGKFLVFGDGSWYERMAPGTIRKLGIDSKGNLTSRRVLADVRHYLSQKKGAFSDVEQQLAHQLGITRNRTRTTYRSKQRPKAAAMPSAKVDSVAPGLYEITSSDGAFTRGKYEDKDFDYIWVRDDGSLHGAFVERSRAEDVLKFRPFLDLKNLELFSKGAHIGGISGKDRFTARRIEYARDKDRLPRRVSTFVRTRDEIGKLGAALKSKGVNVKLTYDGSDDVYNGRRIYATWFFKIFIDDFIRLLKDTNTTEVDFSNVHDSRFRYEERKGGKKGNRMVVPNLVRGVYKDPETKKEVRKVIPSGTPFMRHIVNEKSPAYRYNQVLSQEQLLNNNPKRAFKATKKGGEPFAYLVGDVIKRESHGVRLKLHDGTEVSVLGRDFHEQMGDVSNLLPSRYDLLNKPIEVGDRMRYRVRPSNQDGIYHSLGEVSLMKPSQSRLERYKKQVAEKRDALKNLPSLFAKKPQDYAAIRKQLSRIIRNEPTWWEHKKLQDMFVKVPVPEWPLIHRMVMLNVDLQGLENRRYNKTVAKVRARTLDTDIDLDNTSLAQFSAELRNALTEKGGFDYRQKKSLNRFHALRGVSLWAIAPESYATKYHTNENRNFAMLGVNHVLKEVKKDPKRAKELSALFDFALSWHSLSDAKKNRAIFKIAAQVAKDANLKKALGKALGRHLVNHGEAVLSQREGTSKEMINLIEDNLPTITALNGKLPKDLKGYLDWRKNRRSDPPGGYAGNPRANLHQISVYGAKHWTSRQKADYRRKYIKQVLGGNLRGPNGKLVEFLWKE